jgi:hypothetical protein
VLCEKNVLDDLEPDVDRPVEGRGGAGVCEGGLSGHYPGGLANRPGQHSTNHSQNLVYIFPVFFKFLFFPRSDRVNNRHTITLLRIFIFFSYFFCLHPEFYIKKIIQKTPQIWFDLKEIIVKRN